MIEWKFKVKKIDLATGGIKVAVINKEDAQDMDIHGMDRIQINVDGRNITAIVDLTDTFVNPGYIGLFYEVYSKINVEDGEVVSVHPVEKPASVRYIRKKMDGVKLTKDEIFQIIQDLMDEKLSDVEASSFVAAAYMRGLDEDETIALTEAIVNSGETLHLKAKRVFDKHCIGGVPGNRTTMLIVPIVASAGLVIPKTSSRAITSPAGTADTMEVLAPVALEKDKVEEVVNKANGCIVWGGAVNLASADDKLIRLRHPLSLDPRGMLLASIMAKKKAVGATDVIIDIPIGMGAKVQTRENGLDLAEDFKRIGGRLRMNIKTLLTNGSHPIGSAIGPAVEAREILRILNGEKVSLELVEKSCELAGILLEMGGKAEKGKGKDVAYSIINNGRALEKMREIIELQGGNPEIKPDEIPLGPVEETITAGRSGRIMHIDNKIISAMVRAAGAPKDKEAGMYLLVEEGDKIKEGQPLFTLYAKTQRKIEQAMGVYQERSPFQFERIILEID